MRSTISDSRQNLTLSTMQPAYFPSLEFFWKAAQCDIIVLTDHFQYTKRSPLTISAPLQLSQPSLRIPVRHGNPTAAIYEKQIDPDSNWQKKHLHTFRHMFHHAPYEYIYLPLMEELLANHPASLADFLTETLIKIIELLHLNIKIVRASQLPHVGTNEQLILNWCNNFKCTQYISEQTVFDRKLVKPEILTQDKISSQSFTPFPEYHILTSNRDLSILYFLFHYGPEAGYLLRQYLPLK